MVSSAERDNSIGFVTFCILIFRAEVVVFDYGALTEKASEAATLANLPRNVRWDVTRESMAVAFSRHQRKLAAHNGFMNDKVS